MLRFCVITLLWTISASAETLVAARVVPAQTVLSYADVTLSSDKVPGALTGNDNVIGLEARVTLYPGRAIRAGDIGPPTLVDRNQIVTLTYNAGGLGISTEGRALARGGAGDVIRVMNLSSRAVIAAEIYEDGTLHVDSKP